MTTARVRWERIFIYAVFISMAVCAWLLWRSPPPTDTSQLRSAQPPYRLTDYTLTLERTPCLGTCPNFTLTVHPDLTTSLDMIAYGLEADPEGMLEGKPLRYSGMINLAQMEALVTTLERGRFWAVSSSYFYMVTDNPGTKIEVRTPQRTWSVDVYAVPCLSDPVPVYMVERSKDRVPNVFCELARQMDAIACQTYEHGQRTTQTDDMQPFMPPKCGAALR